MKSIGSIQAKTILIIVAAAVFVVPILTSLGKVAATDEESPTPMPTPSLQEMKRNFPSIEYGTEQHSADVRRQSKSKKYDKYRVLDPDTTRDGEEVAFADWLPPGIALPVAESQVVVIGKTAESRAFLSNEKKSVYSEFKIEIEKGFKNVSEASAEEQNLLTAEREGGIVVFPNGFKTWYHVAGQRMPAVGERYLFFLTNDFPQYGRQGDALYLLTAYHLKDGKVYPLDFADGGTHATATRYKGKDEAALLADLESTLKIAPSKLPRIRRLQ